MKLINKLLTTSMALLAMASYAEEKQEYKANWESLKKHKAAPEWFQDAKLGIYFHWGVYSVPAKYSEWYARSMHFHGNASYNNHVKTYDHPAKFPYHDFVPMFKAEHFDAAEWMQLFKSAGAKFAGPVAEHHDGFSMWDSEVTPWNVADMGPKKDITGELAKEAKKQGMKFITTFHHARNLQRYSDPKDYKKELINSKKSDGSQIAAGQAFWQSHYPYIPGLAPASDDPKLSLLYGNIEAEKWHKEIWFGKLKEVIDKYQPDIIWFDSWLDKIPAKYRQEFCAYYLNEAKKLNKDVVIVRKQNDLPLSMSINDHEKSREAKISKRVWMTDDTLSTSSWCYTHGLKIKPADKVIHSVLDTVAKNGIVLLNLSPKSDGTIPQDQRAVLKELGQWMKTNGEAIYATRPFKDFGEGPTKEPEGGLHNAKKFMGLKYTDLDWRYTRSKDNKTIYAMQMGESKTGQKYLLSLLKGYKVAKVTKISDSSNVSFVVKAKGLELTGPSKADKYATAYKITLK